MTLFFNLKLVMIMNYPKKNRDLVANRKVIVCLDPCELQDLMGEARSSAFKTVSGLLRNVFAGREICCKEVFYTHKTELGQVAAILKELEGLEAEMLKIAYVIRSSDSKGALLADAGKAAMLCVQILEAIEPLSALLEKLSKKWLAGGEGGGC